MAAAGSRMRIVPLLLALVAAVGARAQDGRPNVVLVYVDDMDAVGMDRLPGLLEVTRDAGLDVAQAFVPNSICGPSRASLLSGASSHTTGYRFNRRAYYVEWEADGWEQRSFPVLLREAGYYTAHVGKAVNGFPGRQDYHVPPGWDWFATPMTDDAEGDSRQYTDFTVWRSVDGAVDTLAFSGPGQYRTDVDADLAAQAVRRAHDTGRPFFLYLPLYGPHAEPATNPPEAIPAVRHRDAFVGEIAPRTPAFNEADVSDKHDQIQIRPQIPDVDLLDRLYRTRLEAMLAVEDAVRRVRAELEALGELEDTYIFFVSDNGILIGEHRVRFSKGFPYEPSARVPFYVTGPGVAPGASTDRLVSILDLGPTVLDLAGLEAPEYMEGRSLAPLLRGEDVPWRESLLLEGWLPDGSPYYRALRTEAGLKYAEFATDGTVETYDLRFDPFEVESQTGILSAAGRAALAARLDSLATCAGAACRAVEDRAVPRIAVLEGRVSGVMAPGGALSVGWGGIGLGDEVEVVLAAEGGGTSLAGVAPSVEGALEVVVPDSLGGATARVELRSGGATWTGDWFEIDREPLEASFRAYPNPTTGRLTVALDVHRGQRVYVEVFDVLGRRVGVVFDDSMEPNTRVRVDTDLSGLPSGVYVVRARGREFTFEQTVTVAR